MAKEIIFKGSAVALVTPFRNGKIDFKCFERLIDFQVKNKSDALVICGTTGESPTLKDYEKIMLFDTAVSHTEKKIPVIAGTGTNDTTHSVYLSQEAENCGVDALLLVTPYYNKTTQKGLVKHYEKIASSVNIPCIVYNVPSRTGLDINTDTYKALSEIPNIWRLQCDPPRWWSHLQPIMTEKQPFHRCRGLICLLISPACTGNAFEESLALKVVGSDFGCDRTTLPPPWAVPLPLHRGGI